MGTSRFFGARLLALLLLAATMVSAAFSPAVVADEAGALKQARAVWGRGADVFDRALAAEKQGDRPGAYALYREALDFVVSLRTHYPEWNKPLVERRAAECEARLRALRAALGGEADKLDNAHLAKRNQDLRRYITELRRQMAARERDFEGDRGAAIAENASREAENARLRADNQRLRNEFEAFKSMAEPLEGLRGEAGELRRVMNEMRLKAVASDAAASAAQEESEGLREDSQALRQELTSARAELAKSLEGEKLLADKLAAAERQIAGLQGSLEGGEDTLAGLRGEIERTKEELKLLEAGRSDSNARLEAAGIERESLLKRLAVAEERASRRGDYANTAAEEIEKLNRDITAANAKVEAVAAENSSVREQNQLFQERLEQVVEHFHSAHFEKNKLDNQLREAKTDFEAREREYAERLEAELAAAAETEKRLNGQIEHLNKALTDKRLELAAHQEAAPDPVATSAFQPAIEPPSENAPVTAAEFAELLAQQADLRRRLEGSETARETLQQELARSREERQSLAKAREALENIPVQAVGENELIVDLMNRNRELREQLDTIRRDLASHVQESRVLRDSSAQDKELAKIIEDLRLRLAKQQSDNAKLKQELEKALER